MIEFHKITSIEPTRGFDEPYFFSEYIVTAVVIFISYKSTEIWTTAQ